MPIHMLSVLKMPKAMYVMIKRIFLDFLWGSSMEVRKRKWVSWSLICKPVEGGLGIGCGPLQDFCPVVGSNAPSVAEVVDDKANSASGVWLKKRPDVLIWNHSLEDNFIVKSAWEISKKCGQPCDRRKWLWQANIPKRMYFLCWRAKRGAVLTNDQATKQTQVGWIRGALPILISSSLWKARCSARMKGTSFQVEDTIRYVKFLLKDVSCNLQKFQKMKTNDNLVMENLSIPIVPIIMKRAAYVKWEMIARGNVKLNVDGGACSNPGEAGGGGVIRDSNGKCIARFGHHYRTATNTVAECRALLDGLRLCKELRFQDVLVGSDSSVVMNWLAFGIFRLWFLWDFWEEIRKIAIEINACFRHIFLEENMVANFLAKEGTHGVNTDFARLKGLIRMDWLEMAFIREK
ncbi:hypothetical protein I3760_16G057900 [Carya illinoinensis]|nr:hypothetical protein I3760_16G057900 [Carya illinoinensis]